MRNPTREEGRLTAALPFLWGAVEKRTFPVSGADSSLIFFLFNRLTFKVVQNWHSLGAKEGKEDFYA
jgi:hypothetical protein